MEQQPIMEAQEIAPELHHHAPLTSSEIAKLWRTNIYFSMLKCITKHFLNTLEDPDLRPPYEFAASLCETRVNRTSDILKLEGQPVPKGFTDEDVKLEAPRLFTDSYYYFHMLSMTTIGLVLGGTNLGHSVREDVRNFFSEALSTTTKLYNWITRIMLEKGIYVRPPIITTNLEEDMVIEQSFLRGFLGERRPLLAEEIEYLLFGIENNEIGGALTTGFQQTAQ